MTTLGPRYTASSVSPPSGLSSRCKSPSLQSWLFSPGRAPADSPVTTYVADDSASGSFAIAPPHTPTSPLHPERARSESGGSIPTR